MTQYANIAPSAVRRSDGPCEYQIDAPHEWCDDPTQEAGRGVKLPVDSTTRIAVRSVKTNVTDRGVIVSLTGALESGRVAGNRLQLGKACPPYFF